MYRALLKKGAVHIEFLKDNVLSEAEGSKAWKETTAEEKRQVKEDQDNVSELG